jgi:hypothetical protein
MNENIPRDMSGFKLISLLWQRHGMLRAHIHSFLRKKLPLVVSHSHPSIMTQ